MFEFDYNSYEQLYLSSLNERIVKRAVKIVCGLFTDLSICTLTNRKPEVLRLLLTDEGIAPLDDLINFDFSTAISTSWHH